MERRKVDILCVQETRWKGSKARSIGAGFKLFYYGVDSKRNGVGVVLKEEFGRNVLEVKRVSDRVMSLKLEIEGVMLNVVSGYAPQVGCGLEEKERFWSELDEVMESIPTGERVVIGADFNGHVGEGNRGDEKVMSKFGVKERNLEGQMVVDFAKRMDMGVVNTYFQKREEHRVTYKSGGRRTQVDYILCRRGNLKEISDCKVVVGESVARQHRMVVCRMTLMVCKTKRSKIEIEKKTKWWKLKKEECCEEFRQKLRQALGGQVLLPDDWETTAEVIRETGRKVLGVSSGRRKEDKETWWWNEEVQDSIQRKRLAKKKWDMDRTEENRQEYKELQRRVKREVSKAKQKAYDELYTRLDTREGEKDLYRLARQRDRDGKDVHQVRVIKDSDGRVLTSEECVQRRWKEYFEELMNEENEREKRVEGVNSVEQKVDKIRKDEVRKALKRMKSGKAVGPDDIPVEVWKCLGEAAVEFLTSLFNRVLENLEKAYDSVPREELWYCMRKSGVAEKYVRVVQDMYERSRTVVRCAVGQTEEFKVEVGLHQGLALSPFLFAIVMDQLSEEVRQESPWTMMFADDIVICSESREQVEENLERWRFALERRGTKVSRSKTEYMCVNEREGSGTVRLQGEEVTKVQEFKYLGSTVQSNGECGKERRESEYIGRRMLDMELPGKRQRGRPKRRADPCKEGDRRSLTHTYCTHKETTMAAFSGTCDSKVSRPSRLRQKNTKSKGSNVCASPMEQSDCSTVLEKSQEFFQICDIEDKGFVTRRDMQSSDFCAGPKARSIGAGFKLFYYGVDSKRNGVGVVLKEEFVRNVLEVKRVSDRVMSLKLEIEGVMLNVVSGYAPQVGCELKEKERFWSELYEVMESIPTGERVVIGVDFNGHVGEGNRGDEEVMGKFGVKERTLEGQMVVDFAKRMDMAVVNTYFQKREEHRVTYKSGGRSTQVDYILCRRGNLKEISDCKVVVGESVARQHRMVVCRMTLMVCKKKRSKIEKKTKWWKLKKEECCEEFRQKLRKALGGQVVLPDDWETTAVVIRETGRKVLGVSSGRRKEDKETWWWNEEVQDSIQRKRLAKKKWDMDRTEENRQEYKELQHRVKRERLLGEFPLSAEELENVFDTLDADGNGYLTPEEFSSGFSEFIFGPTAASAATVVAQQPIPEHAPEPVSHDTLYQSQWENKLSVTEDEEEKHFSILMENLGASNVFEDPRTVRNLWAQLRRDEPRLLSNFEEFLGRVTYQIKEANQEKSEMETALKRKAASHDDEIQRLYEEMEQQIKNEKDRIILQDSERFLTRSQDLEYQLSSKERELEMLSNKQKRLEQQCRELHSEQRETAVENVKLKQYNEELAHELEHTTQELSLAQEQLSLLQEQASRLHEERDMEVYRITEGLQRERASLLKQLDLLRQEYDYRSIKQQEMNKHLRDEQDMCYQKPKNSAVKASRAQGSGYTERKQSFKGDEEDILPHSKRKSAVGIKVPTLAIGQKDQVEGLRSPAHQLQRIISIEEDHLPQLLQKEYQAELRNWSEEEDLEDGIDLQMTSIFHSTSTPISQCPPADSRHAHTPTSPRGQPVGKETVQLEEGANSGPDRLFKIVLVGNSNVGKTSLLRRFCDDCFYPGTSATVGIDYSVKTLLVDNSQVALQMWDTAGQERYRSITKQFFRKADGVVVMYDITCEQTFTAVRSWLASVQEGAGDDIPVMLLGNKTDLEGQREIQFRVGEKLAMESRMIFFECSAFSGHNVTESMVNLARILKEQEDREKEKTVSLIDAPSKKKSCC
ncbi:hypothetical protein QTP86_020086 [Hemibagrus guttatus]|nr:hypothetical protein QTP86_020086 [Hemibagrus guttatus]